MIIDGIKKWLFKDDADGIQVMVDGSLRSIGTATSWKDMVLPLIGKKLIVTTGKVDYDFDSQSMKFQDGGNITNINDLVGGNLEINHEFLMGSAVTFKPHIHWFQEIESNVAQTCTFTMQYRLQKNGIVRNDTWLTSICQTGGVNDIWDFTAETDGYYNQITRFPDMVLDCSVSDTIQVKMTKTDSTSGDMYVYFFDIHGQVDGLGSEEEIHKD